MEFINPISVLVSGLIAILATVWSFSWWLSKQFSSMRTLIYERIERLQNSIFLKIESHEKQDDHRFKQVTDDLWEIKVRNASRDSLFLPLIDDLRKANKKEENK